MLNTSGLAYAVQKKTLIKDICVQFYPGKIYGIIVPNGSGKTTLLKTVAGIRKPTMGSVLWQGRDLLSQSRQAISRTITMVPQNLQPTFDFTVEEFVAMGRYAHGRDGFNKGLIDKALHYVDAEAFRKHPVNQLSQGERQRVYIARSLVTEAPVMLLDEPVAHLDIRHQRDIWMLMKQLATQGKTIVVTNHDLMYTKQYCEYLYLFHEG